MQGKILTGNDLRSGEVLFFSPAGWVHDHRRARLASTPDESESLLAHGRVALAANLIVDPYLIEVELDSDRAPWPIHLRERFRLFGPSVRPDLGRPAE